MASNGENRTRNSKYNLVCHQDEQLYQMAVTALLRQIFNRPCNPRLQNDSWFKEEQGK